jgi:hypothetical protein
MSRLFKTFAFRRGGGAFGRSIFWDCWRSRPRHRFETLCDLGTAY